MKTNKIKKLAIMCSGGSAPGMATCVVSFIKKCKSLGIEPVTIADGFQGLHDNHFMDLTTNPALHFVDNGSALIGTSRCPKFRDDRKFREQCYKNLCKQKIDGLVVVGGEGSYKGAWELSKLGAKIITIPATIDNDVASTGYTVGYDTCLNTVCACLCDLNDVFSSHHGIAIVELMGKGCPDVTVRSAIASNSTYMVTKYSKLKPEGFLKIANDAFSKGKPCAVFLVAEKLYPDNGPQSLGTVAKWLEKQTGRFTRHCVLGYLQRGGNPSARDRLLANYMVNIAVNQFVEGKYNKAICRKARNTVAIDLAKAMKMKRRSWNQHLVTIFNKINQN